MSKQKFESRLKTAQWVGAVQVLQTREGVTQTLQVQSKVCKKKLQKKLQKKTAKKPAQKNLQKKSASQIQTFILESCTDDEGPIS